MAVKRLFLRSPAMGGGVCNGTRAARGGEWPCDTMRAGGALCAFLLVAWMAAGVTRSPAVPEPLWILWLRPVHRSASAVWVQGRRARVKRATRFVTLSLELRVANCRLVY